MVYHRDPDKHLGREEVERVEQIASAYWSRDMEQGFNRANQGSHMARGVKLRKLLATGKLAVMDDAAMAEVHELRRRMMDCRTAELPAGKTQAYIDARVSGVVEDADARRMEAEKTRYRELWDALAKVAFFQPIVRQELSRHPEVTLSPEEKQAAIERWNEEFGFLSAKAQFDEMLSSTDDFAVRNDLRERFPEFQ